ncbi:cold shock domain-containing protein [Promicromonospora sp. MEB111]|uniref:cold shock domain-containing protein n=1 Tax=Promicromonospora sp. MEB111 TaxID=3040301 RepID=UPI00254EEA54|nr:cold shock domain-containing protein [Promicromonospora sp. MEB111]
MAEGTVSAYDAGTGWGVIVPDGGGPPLRVHQVEIRTHGDQALERGERVAFAIAQHADGPRAAAVTPLGPILTEEELAGLGLVPEPGPAQPARPDQSDQPVKLPTWMRAVIALVALAALPSLVIGVIQVANGHEEWTPLLISGVIMLVVLRWIPHNLW